jgi:hypothetical protein
MVAQSPKDRILEDTRVEIANIEQSLRLDFEPGGHAMRAPSSSTIHKSIPAIPGLVHFNGSADYVVSQRRSLAKQSMHYRAFGT